MLSTVVIAGMVVACGIVLWLFAVTMSPPIEKPKPPRCQHCGEPLLPDEQRCPMCGSLIVSGITDATYSHRDSPDVMNQENVMQNQGALLHTDEALRYIEGIEDPATRSLVNMAFVHLVRTVHLEKTDAPRCDLDALFLVRVLKEFFSEHDVLARALDGEKVGAWFEDEA